jgi:hypothetical protein
MGKLRTRIPIKFATSFSKLHKVTMYHVNLWSPLSYLLLLGLGLNPNGGSKNDKNIYYSSKINNKKKGKKKKVTKAW